MFRNLGIAVFLFYVLSVTALLGVLYYFVVFVQLQNLLPLFAILLTLTLFGGFVIAKLSIDPLAEYIKNLQNLSTETLHELNLPISTIKTNIGMLKNALASEKEQKRAQRIESACEMLQQRYNELDYMIKLQSANITHETIALDELVQNRVAFLKQIYQHITFSLELAPLQIQSDRVGLSKVIDNLLDNAVKYSLNIHKIDITLHDQSLAIKDYGCGMDEVELLKIFDRYYQSNQNMRGFGIGLSMVKRFCDTNNILLGFKSKVGDGTTVTLTFKEK
ncbi:MAG: HAMP domain-containing sensor histidine kinase [Sulfurimonas sp.]|uniref:sensor histidine kinase n=1 Tax=Sulfurimonas sp. TaxID=2022749 RepID=UPI00260DD367|nr:HAMP domain-containing sensor histidine kinase [Sulfurimonas sp.]MDD2651624.1 HAMP domain-containing sensor histidine kinase [Sulfurimonas sp.]MDD3451435.1 HAMP domain-containing sensor histidine kinase [Sulfurimonas sp.]